MRKYLLCHVWRIFFSIIIIGISSGQRLPAQTAYSLDSTIRWKGPEGILQRREVIQLKNEDGQRLLSDVFNYSDNGEIKAHEQLKYTYFDGGEISSFTQKRSFFPLDTFFIYSRREYNTFGDRTYHESLQEYNVSPFGPTLEVTKKVIDTTVSNSGGRVIERFILEEENAETSLSHKLVYVRAGDRIDTIFRYTPDAIGQLQISRTTTYKYDPNTSKNTINTYNQQGILVQKAIQTFHENELPDSSWMYFFSNNGDTIDYILNTNTYSSDPFTRSQFSLRIKHPSGEILFGTSNIFRYLDEKYKFLDEELVYSWNRSIEEFQLEHQKKYYYSQLTAQSFTPPELHLKLYPNPTDHLLYLKSSSDLKIREIIVISIDGRVLKIIKQTGHHLDTSDWPAGLYTLLINGQISRKVLVQH